jgi:hypothetical protein
LKVIRQRGRKLDDGRGEDKVEMVLEPGGVALLARLLGRPQPRWLEPKRRSADHADEP